jgi:hypothetical protein
MFRRSSIPPMIAPENSQTSKFVILRVIAALLALPPTIAALGFISSNITTGKINIISAGFDLGFVIPAALLWWLALRGHQARSRSIILPALAGTIALGIIGYLVGDIFFGFLMSLLSGGPVGIIIGAIIGGGIGLWRQGRRAS